MTTKPKDPCLEAFVREFGESPVAGVGRMNGQSELYAIECATEWDARLVGFRAAWQALHEDAERYRWLRDNVKMKYWQHTHSIFQDHWTQLNAAIDAARKGEAP